MDGRNLSGFFLFYVKKQKFAVKSVVKQQKIVVKSVLKQQKFVVKSVFIPYNNIRGDEYVS